MSEKDDKLNAQYLDLAKTAFNPSLRPDETIELAGQAMMPVPFLAYLLGGFLFISSVKMARTHFMILTTQRLVFVKSKNLLTGKLTPDAVAIKHQYELAAITSAVYKGNAAIFQTTTGQVKLVRAWLTLPKFLESLVNEINRIKSGATAGTVAKNLIDAVKG